MHVVGSTRWVFPNVLNGTCAPIEIAARATTGAGVWRALSPAECDDLGLFAIPAFIGSIHGLRVHREHSVPAWSVSGDHLLVRGPSAHLAALLAAIDRRRSGETRKSSMIGSRVWASAGLRSAADGSVVVRSIGGAPKDQSYFDLGSKLRAFLCSSDMLFLLAAADAVALQRDPDMPKFTLLSLDQFIARMARQEVELEKIVLGVEEFELPRLLATLFRGIFESQTIPVTVLCSDHASSIRHAGELTGHLHSESVDNFRISLYLHPSVAFDATRSIAAANPHAKVVLLQRDLCVDRFTLERTAVRQFTTLLATAQAGRFLVDESVARALVSVRELRGRYLGVVRVGEFSDRVRMYSLTHDQSSSVLRSVAMTPYRWSPVAMAVAWLFTLARVPLGVVVADRLMHWKLTTALSFYSLGLFTDVFDGWIAREFQGETTAGKHFDPIVDMLFNALSVLGLVWGLATLRAGVAAVVFPIVFTAGLVLISRWWVLPGSGLAKVRSGVIRLFLALFIVSRLSWSEADRIIVGALVCLAIVAGIYELKVLQQAIDGNEMTWTKGSPDHSRRPDQQLLYAVVGVFAMLIHRWGRGILQPRSAILAECDAHGAGTSRPATDDAQRAAATPSAPSDSNGRAAHVESLDSSESN